MRKRGVLTASVDVVVPFFDIDLMQIVWHGHYVKYLEEARCALLSMLDYNYPQMQASGYAWPVVDLQLRYVRGATFGQRVRVHVDLIEWEGRMKLNYLIVDAITGERLTRATSTQVAVDISSREMQFVSPPVFLERVRQALALHAGQAVE